MKQSKSNELRSGRSLVSAIAIAILAMFVVSGSIFAQEDIQVNAKPTIVLVHGLWADGSSWSPVIERLQAQGYDVIAPQFSHVSLEANIARLHQVLANLTGPVILAAHSYGGQVITAGAVDQPNVVGLVYVAAFGLDEGESIGALLQGVPAPPALQNLIIDELGYAWLGQDDFVNLFAEDIDPVQANVMYAVQQPAPVALFEDVMGVPAWRSLPSWFLVTANDQVVPPDGQRLFAGRMGATTVEIESGHVAMISHPDEVANLIMTAATEVTTPESAG
jgi:pimeloyl-ACP methyl ester carboxylesterase